jgi:deoxycytidine triphosphate deaminase
MKKQKKQLRRRLEASLNAIIVSALADPQRWKDLLKEPKVVAAMATAFGDIVGRNRKLREELMARFGSTGSVLSNKGIREALKQGRLVIDPDPRFAHGEEDPLGPTTVTLTLGCTFIRLPQGLKVDLVELRRQGKPWTEFLRENGQKVTLKPGEKFELLPGAFVLAETLERIHFPSKRKRSFQGQPLLCALLTGLTRNARTALGIELAERLHCGDDHRPTLELHNLGPAVVVLTAGESPIANLTVMEISHPPDDHWSAVRGQVSPCGTRAPDSAHANNGRNPPAKAHRRHRVATRTTKKSHAGKR